MYVCVWIHLVVFTFKLNNLSLMVVIVFSYTSSVETDVGIIVWGDMNSTNISNQLHHNDDH